MALPKVALRTTTRRPGTGRALTAEQASALQLEYRAGGISTTALGHKYGVSQQTAHRIATGRMYADLPSAPPRTAWTDPDVRTWGNPTEDELRALKAMLRAYPGRWAQVKRTRSKPAAADCWSKWGVECEARKIAPGHWGLFVRWPAESTAVA
jgi:hypothetical protein